MLRVAGGGHALGPDGLHEVAAAMAVAGRSGVCVRVRRAANSSKAYIAGYVDSHRGMVPAVAFSASSVLPQSAHARNAVPITPPAEAISFSTVREHGFLLSTALLVFYFTHLRSHSTLASLRKPLVLLGSGCFRKSSITTFSPVTYRTRSITNMTAQSFYDLEADMPKGDKLSMAQLKDKVVLIVNVASKVRRTDSAGASGT